MGIMARSPVCGEDSAHIMTSSNIKQLHQLSLHYHQTSDVLLAYLNIARI